MIRFLLPFLLIAVTSAHAAAPRVLTSIRPLQLIANDLMQGVGEADVLLDSRQSPHHFQLRPSQLEKLQRTDLLIWISDDFETGLARLGNSLPAGASRLQLLPLLHPEDAHEDTPSEQGDVEGDDHEHAHEGNAHLWLSPRDDIRIAGIIAERLSRLDPDHAGDYARNRARLVQRLEDWQNTTRARLQQARLRYLLDHPFLGGFEQDLGIRAIGSLAGANAREGSLRRLRQLTRQLRQTPARCLFSAEWPADRLSRQLARQFGLKLIWLPVLDPDRRAASIVDLLDGIARRMLDCAKA